MRSVAATGSAAVTVPENLPSPLTSSIASGFDRLIQTNKLSLFITNGVPINHPASLKALIAKLDPVFPHDSVALLASKNHLLVHDLANESIDLAAVTPSISIDAFQAVALNLHLAVFDCTSRVAPGLVVPIPTSPPV